jgi:adenylate cyclase
MALEIERKFLLPEVPAWLGKQESAEIEQGYLAVSSDAEVRVRRRNGECTLTAKRGRGEVRDEAEIEITGGQFEELWPLTEGRRLRKTRHLVKGEGETIEVDVYGDELDGLVVGEVEFDSEESSQRFEPPRWLGQEVTGRDEYANESLAIDGAPARGGRR